MVFASCLNSSFALRLATTLPSSLDPTQFEFFPSFVRLWFYCSEFCLAFLFSLMFCAFSHSCHNPLCTFIPCLCEKRSRYPFLHTFLIPNMRGIIAYEMHKMTAHFSFAVWQSKLCYYFKKLSCDVVS